MSYLVIYNQENKVKSHTREDIGWREYMEDTKCSLVSLSKPGLENYSFFAVFDGHASSVVSKHLSKELFNEIFKTDPSLFTQLANKSFKLTQSNADTTIERIKQAMKQSFLNIDRKMFDDLPEFENLRKNIKK
jgi:serine/threonine protein phosphatase PrpC